MGAAIAAGALALAGCGEEERFDARGFVEEVGAEGVELKLGKPLITASEGAELYAVELESLSELPGTERGNVGGSLGVYENTEDADRETETCRAAGDLLCYQASNVVIVLEGGGIEAQRLGVAMERLSDD